MNMRVFGTTLFCACAIAAPSIMSSELERVKEAINILNNKNAETSKFIDPIDTDQAKILNFLNNDLPSLYKDYGCLLYKNGRGADFVGYAKDSTFSTVRVSGKHVMMSNDEKFCLVSRIDLISLLSRCELLLANPQFGGLSKRLVALSNEEKRLGKEWRKQLNTLESAAKPD